MVMNADFATAQPGEVFFGPIGAGSIEAVRLLMIDALDFKPFVQMIPSGGFVSMNRGALGNTGANEGGSLALAVEHGRNGVAAPLANDNHHLALAGLVLSETAVLAIFLEVGGLHVATEIAAINLGLFALPADNAALEFVRHGFAELVQEDEGALVGNAQITAQCQGALALHFVAEDRDGRQIAAQGHLVAGEQRPAGKGEVLFAATTAEARGTLEAAAIIGINAAALRANRLAVGIGPTDATEGHFSVRVLHLENLAQRDGLSCSGKKKVLCHLVPLSFMKAIICERYWPCQQQSIRYDSLQIGGAMNIKSEEEWAERAAAFLKHKLKDTEVTYAELAKRLRKHGLKETEASITNKLARGTFPATFFLACIAALELEGVALEEI